MTKAIIFDVDGTLADTEQHGHLPACNAAFEQLGLPVYWTWEAFAAMQPIPGNARRLRIWLQDHTDMGEEEIEGIIERFVPLKQQLYISAYLPALHLRPGVEQLIEDALARGLRLAIVSTTHEAQIHALLKHHLPEAYAHVQPILGRESGPKPKPEGRLYETCLARMALAPEDALVIEDSEVGFRAAQGAGIPCVVTYNDYTFGQNFSGARLVVRDLACFDLDRLLCCVEPR